MNINQLKLEVNDSFKKDRKITTNFEPTDDSGVINNFYLDEKNKKTDGHKSYIESDYNEIKIQYNKQSVEETLIQRAGRTTIQILHDNGLFDGFPNADEVLKEILFVTRRRGDLEVNSVNQWFYS